MTISFLQTARYNATPRLARLDDGQAKPAPQFDSLDAMIEAMKADAQAIKDRHTGTDQKKRQSADISNEEIAQMVEESPGITAAQIAQATGYAQNLIYARLTTMVRWKCVRSEMKPGITKRVSAYYRVEGVAVESPNKRPKANLRIKVMDYLRENPGSSTREIADNFGKPSSDMASIIAGAKAEGLPIFSKVVKPGSPSVHWVVEAAQ